MNQLWLFCWRICVTRPQWVKGVHGWYISGRGTGWCYPYSFTLQWHHNERDGVSNHQPHHCLLNHCFRHRSKKTSMFRVTGGCFTNVSRALQNILSKFVYRRNRTSWENFKLKLCMCAQSHALGTHTKFRLEIRTLNVISSIVDFREIILESSRNVSETTPWPLCGEFTGDRWIPRTQDQ